MKFKLTILGRDSLKLSITMHDDIFFIEASTWLNWETGTNVDILTSVQQF